MNTSPSARGNAPEDYAADTPVTRVARATQQLREEILSGRLQSGAKVNLGEWAVRLGMSHIPVREALRALGAEGLVNGLPQRGYRVSPVGIDDLHDTYQLRIVLDGRAVRLAAPRLSKQQVSKAETAVKRWSDAIEQGDPISARVWHRRIHFGIYDACGSTWLLRFVSMLWDNSERYQRMSASVRGDIRDREQEHINFVRACSTGSADLAEAALVEHLMRTESSVTSLLEGLPTDKATP